MAFGWRLQIIHGYYLVDALASATGRQTRSIFRLIALLWHVRSELLRILPHALTGAADVFLSRLRERSEKSAYLAADLVIRPHIGDRRTDRECASVIHSTRPSYSTHSVQSRVDQLLFGKKIFTDFVHDFDEFLGHDFRKIDDLLEIEVFALFFFEIVSRSIRQMLAFRQMAERGDEDGALERELHAGREEMRQIREDVVVFEHSWQEFRDAVFVSRELGGAAFVEMQLSEKRDPSGDGGRGGRAGEAAQRVFGDGSASARQDDGGEIAVDRRRDAVDRVDHLGDLVCRFVRFIDPLLQLELVGLRVETLGDSHKFVAERLESVVGAAATEQAPQLAQDRIVSETHHVFHGEKTVQLLI